MKWDRGSLDGTVIIALGSNLKGAFASVDGLLDAALARFRPEGLDVLARSGWWRSAAWPDPDQPPYLNGVVAVETAQDPHATLATLGRLEEIFGRVRGERNGARTLDLDLIAHGRVVDDTSGLTLPHPRANERAFVMRPLAEILPEWTCPRTGLSAAALARTAMIGADAHALPDREAGFAALHNRPPDVILSG